MVPWGKDNVILVRPDITYAEEIKSYREEMLLADSSMDGTGVLKRTENPLEWLNYNKLRENPKTTPEDRVPATQFVLTDTESKRIYGMIQVRHHLNEYLRNFAGNIGYSVRPTERRKGYAIKMLKLALNYCREELHLDKVLVSCLVENEPSRRTILACGGVFEEKVYEHIEGVWLEKYWIIL
ncbi:MAG: GNAT family N-acetyltransferase [Lachnospiraceae bacterium]|nr:GNAT family N-acetyltransferase [Lachnospiraceae bacterium]MBP3610645.1 GNAT family N-acetyltransferase [Lachnospiraceae bacterium]